MKITTQKELDDLIATADKSNTIVLNEDLEITFDCKIPCNLYAHNIVAHNIDARNLNARNIVAYNTVAHDLYARTIYADNIKYYAFCIAYESLKCKSISGTRNNSLHKCLDREIEIIEDEKIQIELTQSQLDKIKHLIK